MAEKWVLMVTAQKPTNIAVIKYWGKRNENLILPINDSISVTLDPQHLCTTTSVAVSPAFTHDLMWLNGKEISLSGDRFQNCLRELRARASDVEDEEKGIKIAKKDWEKLTCTLLPIIISLLLLVWLHQPLVLLAWFFPLLS